MSESTVKQFCECDSFDCMKVISLSISDATIIRQTGHVIIVEGCPTGPEPDDTLISEHDGYALYAE